MKIRSFGLSEAMITNNCYKSNDPSVGLALNSDDSAVKCYFMDTGLLVSQIFSDKKDNDDDIYHKILFDKISLNEGMIMENIVAQMLKSNGYNLYYYSKSDENNQ